MNFFKSILSDEDPPQPETTNSPSSAPRAAAYTSETQQTTELPGPRAASSGAWSFGDLVKTITTRSESVLETYRRDLAEFGSGLRKESDLFREVANNAVKDLPASIDGVMKAISVPEQLSKNSKSESVRNYSRFDSQLDSLQNDVRTYIDEPEDVIEFEKWKLGFVLGERRGEIAEVLKNERVDAIYREVVGGGNGEVDETSFWCRYFYKVWKMREVEDARSKFVRRAVNVDDDDEELSWDVDDDDDDEENVVRENDKKASLDYERENVSSSIVDDDDNEWKLRGGDVKNEVKPSLEHERENVSSSVVVDKNERKLSGGDVFGKDIVDEVKPSDRSVSDEKVELVTKTDENSGVGSVSDHKEKLQVDEDLEWDEIGDIGENDEKSVLSQGGSLKKDEVLKRLNSGDDDEDLSWDIEDDDEPLNAGNSK